MAFVNVAAIFVAAIVDVLIGMWWYSPSMYGKRWMKMMGWTEKDMEKAMKKGMSRMYMVSFVGALVVAFMLALFIKVTSNYFNILSQTVLGIPIIAAFNLPSTIVVGALVGFLIWLGFRITPNMVMSLWEGRAGQAMINAKLDLVTFVIMGIILATWV